MKLNLLYVHAESMGYGRYGLKLAETLAAMGVDVYDDIQTPPEPGAQATGWERDEAPDRRPGICNVAAWVSTPTHAKGWWKGQVPVISTMWEATVLPAAFRETLHHFDTVIVPSWHNRDLFGEYHPNVKFVPLGVDPAEWHYHERIEPRRYFRFLIGGSGKRKGTDLAYAAFRKTFPDGSWGDGPIPVLVMKNPRGEEFYGDRIEVMSGRLTAEEEQFVYRTAHCYLQPSRGEGFGLQPLQAIAQGIPTILTDAHGHESFAQYGYRLSTTFKKADYFIYGDAGDWWEPSLDELCDHMRYVYENYDAACERARFGAQAVAAGWTWRHTAEQFLDAIGRDRFGDYDGPGEWFEPDIARYRVVVNQHHAADIGGYQYRFEPGRDYWETADVKRLLFERGLLEPSCVEEPDHGLTDAQVQRIPLYSAAMSYCPTCGQQLNSKPTLSDDIYERLMRAEIR